MPAKKPEPVVEEAAKADEPSIPDFPAPPVKPESKPEPILEKPEVAGKPDLPKMPELPKSEDTVPPPLPKKSKPGGDLPTTETASIEDEADLQTRVEEREV